MSPALQILYEQLGSSWANLPRQAKILLPIVGVLVLAAFVGLIMFSGTEENKLLLSTLSERDRLLIQRELTNAGVSFDEARLTTEGSLYVPESLADRARMILTVEKLPQSGSGFDVFDQSGMGDTFLDYNRKAEEQAEISIRNSIESLDPVKYAAVDVTPMVDSPFAVEKEPAKASLTVELKHGRRLDYKQIDGIANMVAASVRGLTVDNVKIIDSFGRPLIMMPETTDQDLIVGLRNQQYEFEKRVAAELEQKIMRRMTPLVGNPQYVQAIVRVEGDFDEISTDQVEYNPTGLEAAELPVETETTIEDTTAGPGTTVGSQPGMVPNTIGSSSSLNPNQELTVTRNSSEKTRLVSKTTTITKRAPAKIKKITATLLIDQRKQMGPNGVITYTPWTPAEELLLTGAIQTAIGYDQTRGDQVSVVSLPFDRTYPAEQSTINTQKERLAVAGSAAKYVIVLVVVAALMLLMRSFFSGLGSTDAPQAQARVGGGGVAAISGEPSLEDDELSDEGLAGMGSDAAGILGDDDSGGALEGSEELEIARLQREISTSVQSNPEIVVALMRTWLESESET